MIPSLYEPFQKWAAKGSVYIISDPHLYDEDCAMMDPFWPKPEEYITSIKKLVGKNDTLICLGDVGSPELFAKIRGHKVLIMGNHDLGRSNYEPYFDEIYEGALVIAPKIILSHEPLPGITWACNIHGHNHAYGSNDDYHYNVCANRHNYEPLNLGKFIKDGGLAHIQDIHRITIDRATERKR